MTSSGVVDDDRLPAAAAVAAALDRGVVALFLFGGHFRSVLARVQKFCEGVVALSEQVVVGADAA